MTECSGPWVAFYMLTTLLAVPFGVPLLVASWKARRSVTPGWAVGANLVAAAGLVVFLFVSAEHPGDPRWIPFLFAPAFLVWSAVLLRDRPWLRDLGVIAALLPILGALGYGVWLAVTWSCAG